MQSLLSILAKSFLDLLRPRVLLFLLIPPALFLVAGVVAAIYFWNPLTEALLYFFSDTFLNRWISPDIVTGILAFFALSLLLIPALIVVISIFFSVLLVPTMVRWIHAADYPGVKLQSQGLHLESLWITLKLSVIYLVLVVVTFPINLIFPPLGILLNWWGLGYFNARLFSREILDEILPHAQVGPFFKQQSSALTNASFVTAILYFVPFLNLLAPTWTALVLTRICLEKVQMQSTQHAS